MSITLTQYFAGIYSVNLTDAKENLLVQINENGPKVVKADEVEGEHKPDVSINISSSDLAGVLKVRIPIDI